MILQSVPPSVGEFFKTYDAFILAGHQDPDGDCVGSSLALESFLKRAYRCKTCLLSAGPFARPEIRAYESRFLREAPPDFTPESAALIILDCSNRERLGEIAASLEGFPTLIIDHHASNDCAEARAAFVNPTAPSVTALVQQIIESLGGVPTPDEASLLFFGLAADTGFFRHLDGTSACVFAAASRLIECGANPKKIFALMHGGKSLASRKLLAAILSRLELHYEGRLAFSEETLADAREFGMEKRDSDSLYQLIQSIEGVEAICVIRQETETACAIGFRSIDLVDVSAVARRFGGGGHKQASGASAAGTIETLKPRLIQAFAEAFEAADQARLKRDKTDLRRLDS